MSSKNILITGATGQQGGAVIESLLGKGNNLFGLTRKPDSDKGKALAGKGVTLIKGDLCDLNVLKSAFAKMDSLFLVTTPFEAGVEEETLQGITAVDAAKAAGIKHIVFSSVASADQNTGIPHFDSKYKVEKHLRESGVPFTILAPAFFYDNMLAPFVLPGLRNGTFALAMPKDVKLQCVSVKTIGGLSALALEDPVQFIGKRIDYAGDALTGTGFAEIIGQAGKRKIGYSEVPIDQVRASSEDMASMYEWFTRVGYNADIEGLKAAYPKVSWDSFSEWTARQDWRVLEESKSA